MNHDAAAERDEIAAEDRARRFVPEGGVIRRVTRRVQRDKRVIADSDEVAVAERLPVDSVAIVYLRPRQLAEAGRRVRGGDRRSAGGMIGMAVRDEHGFEARTAGAKRRPQIVEV